MSTFGNAVQAAIYGALVGDSTLSGAVVGIYDDVPQAIDSGAASAFPFVTIGEDVLTEWDTDDYEGAQGSITVHVWSRAAGRKECKTIQGYINDVLARSELPVAGHHLIAVQWVSDESYLDADGRTRHGVSTYQITIRQS